MDVDTFFNHIRGELIRLITRELTDLNSARIQTNTCSLNTCFLGSLKTRPLDRVEKAFNSRMTSVHRGSDLDQTVDGMIAHMKLRSKTQHY